jgi:hypothetical protein
MGLQALENLCRISQLASGPDATASVGRAALPSLPSPERSADIETPTSVDRLLQGAVGHVMSGLSPGLSRSLMRRRDASLERARQAAAARQKGVAKGDPLRALCLAPVLASRRAVQPLVCAKPIGSRSFVGDGK